MFRLPDGSLMEITKVYPMDAVFDSLEDVPEDVITIFHLICGMECAKLYYIFCYTLSCGLLQVKTNKRYAGASKWTVQVVFSYKLYIYCLVKLLHHALSDQAS